MKLKNLLDHCIKSGATDLLISPGTRPMIRTERHLQPFGDSLDEQDTERYAKKLCSDEEQEELAGKGSVDLSYQHNEQNFRVSVFRQNSTISLAFRFLKPDLPTFEDLRLPGVIQEHLRANQGVVFVTGPAGSGKTTTINSMIDYLNREHRRHIITLEDPIEYYHDHKKSLVDQREVGRDVPSFEEGLRSGVRMDPDVLFVGEMRDKETMQAAITAAETGHLVLSTLHTRSAPQSINRIIDTFPPEQQNQVRAQLSMALSVVITQRLLAADGGDMVAAFEVMIGTQAVENMIRDERTEQLSSTLQTGEKKGMRTLEQDLARLVEKDRIHRQKAARVANDEDQFRRALTNARSNSEMG